MRMPLDALPAVEAITAPLTIVAMVAGNVTNGRRRDQLGGVVEPMAMKICRGSR